MSFDHFVESLDNVPPELHRNFTLIKVLDKRTEELMTSINRCIKEYKNTRNSIKRNELKKESDSLFDRLSSYSDDKSELALQTYELIDKNIRRLTSLGTIQNTTDDKGSAPGATAIGLEMPVDPNEPLYCFCRKVSHGEMVACDNKECTIEWFHYGCVGLEVAPKGKWYCGQCFDGPYPSGSKRPKSRSRPRFGTRKHECRTRSRPRVAETRHKCIHN